MEMVANNNNDSNLKSSTEKSSIDNIKFFEDDIDIMEDTNQSKGEVAEEHKDIQRSRVYAKSSNPELNESNIKCVDSTEECHADVTDTPRKCEEKMKERSAIIPVATKSEDYDINIIEGLIKILKLIARPAIMLINRLDYFSVVFTLACVAIIFIIEFIEIMHMV